MNPERNRQSAPQWLLAIDTASDNSGIALFDGDTLHESTWSSERDHTVRLLPEIDAIMRRSEVARAQIGAVGVATGPGMYSSLRVGLSVAKGFALALQIPVIGVSTLDIADFALEGGSHAMAVVATGRNRLVWRVSQGQESRTGTVEDLIASSGGPGGVQVITGDLTDEQTGALLSAGFSVLPLDQRPRRPGALAVIARRRWQEGDYDNAATLDATYLNSSLFVPVAAG